MTNRELIRNLNKGFESGDESEVLKCIAEDVLWEVPNAFIARGKEEFRQNIRNENFTGDPVIEIINEIEEGNYLAVEELVQAKYISGDIFKAKFHNTYYIENQKLKRMTSYLVPIS